MVVTGFVGVAGASLADGDFDVGRGSADDERVRDGEGFVVVRVGSAVSGGGGTGLVSDTAAGAGS
ncbi:hypothetical protein Ait01nite_071280 [Actinoplanes italicus]|nr:hypothetical protein Ait01nite_071280 [Actinoplanes italicus]